MDVEAKPKRPRRIRQQPAAQLDTPDPIEIAMKAVAAGAESSGPARMVLEKHACLIDIQCRREREELGNVRVQRITRWLILAAVAAAIAGIGASLWAASRSSSLVIEAFEVPPALAQRGLTGRVVSARVLDRLAELQRQTDSMRGEKSYAENWDDEIKLDIPQAGISLGDAWRTMKSWLGQQTRIGGEIVATPAGLAITTRAGSLSGGTVEGPAGNVDALITEAAKSIYKATQPYRYAISLPAERWRETEQALLGLTGNPSELERKWAYSGLGVIYRGRGEYRRAVAMARRALALEPNLLPALGNLVLTEERLGHGEAMLTAHSRYERAHQDVSWEEYDRRIADWTRASIGWTAAAALADAAGIRRNARWIEELGATPGFSEQAARAYADAAIIERDYRRAAALVAPLLASASPGGVETGRIALAGARLKRAAEHGDRQGALRAAAEFHAAVAANATRLSIPAQRIFIPERGEVAIALAQGGAASEAQALAAALPRDCYDCLRALGWAALAGGDGAAAMRWLREAVRQGPSLPRAYSDLGQALLGAGDVQGALRQFDLARARAPNWADPLKLSGDALLRQGDAAAAERSYRAAAARAPRWGTLHIHWAEALWRLGRRDEARATLAAAAGMDLAPHQRSLVERMRARAARRS
ncbi:MAG TPA: hypothetical protein VGB59_11980 [Allosphingosinicella sp.]|jgi:tetratricopeptide (TPR) repeat protein